MKSFQYGKGLLVLWILFTACSPRVMKEMVNDLRQVNKPPPSGLGPEQILPDSFPTAGLTLKKAEAIFAVEGEGFENYMPSPQKRTYEGAGGTVTITVCKFQSDGAARAFWSRLETTIRDVVTNKKNTDIWRGNNSFASFLVPGERAVLARQVGEVFYHIEVPASFPNPARLAARIDSDILNHFKNLYRETFKTPGAGEQTPAGGTP